MTPEQRISWAKQLLDNPVLAEILTGMEESAVNFIMNAEPHEHDVRQARAAELRTVRELRSRIDSLSAVIAMQRVKSIA